MPKPVKPSFILHFDSLRKSDVALVGGKNANLGELLSFGMPVPPGFAITADGYKLYIQKNDLADNIVRILSKMDTENSESLEHASLELRKIMESSKIPEELKAEILASYRELGQRLKTKDPTVAVRSSATAEDLPGASFAGQQDTYLFVKGEKKLLKYVVKCFSSLYTPRAIAYRKAKGFEETKVYLSVAVQRMVSSKAAGVIFTLDPATGNRDIIVIEGTWGVGESIVQGRVRPDQFVISKSDLSIKERMISKKEIMTVRTPSEEGGGFIKEVPIPAEMMESPCLTDEQALLLGKYAFEIEKHYGVPMDIEWALDGEDGVLYIVQARPETVWSQKDAKKEEVKTMSGEKKRLLRGLPASPGMVAGKAHVILDAKHIS